MSVLPKPILNIILCVGGELIYTVYVCIFGHGENVIGSIGSYWEHSRSFSHLSVGSAIDTSVLEITLHSLEVILLGWVIFIISSANLSVSFHLGSAVSLSWPFLLQQSVKTKCFRLSCDCVVLHVGCLSVILILGNIFFNPIIIIIHEVLRCNSISVRTTTYSPGNSRSSFKLSAVQLQELDLHFSHIQVCTICKLWWAQTACKSLAQLGALSLLSSVYARWNRSLGHSCFPRLQMHLLTCAQGFKNLWGKAKFSCLSMSAENNRMSKK